MARRDASGVTAARNCGAKVMGGQEQVGYVERVRMEESLERRSGMSGASVGDAMVIFILPCTKNCGTVLL
jgi:hypothetical protein